MPTIVACPSCGGKLRVADALRGQRVRCPACNHTFDGPAEPEPPVPRDLPLDLNIDEPSSSPHVAPPGGLVGAVEVQSSAEDPPPLAEAETPRESRRRPRLRDERLDFDDTDLERLGPRRDAEPDRGAIVLTLGIISLAVALFWCVAPLGAILGLVAWLMGRSDLGKMKRGQMDDNGRGTTQAGLICGILGVVLNGLMTLSCGLFFGFMVYNDLSRPPNTAPVSQPPLAPRPQKMPPKQKFPPINNPRQ